MFSKYLIDKLCLFNTSCRFFHHLMVGRESLILPVNIGAPNPLCQLAKGAAKA